MAGATLHQLHVDALGKCSDVIASLININHCCSVGVIDFKCEVSLFLFSQYVQNILDLRLLLTCSVNLEYTTLLFVPDTVTAVLRNQLKFCLRQGEASSRHPDPHSNPLRGPSIAHLDWHSGHY